jgi:hypothetical protein
MTASSFPKFVGVLFVLVALAHVARLVFDVPIRIGDWTLPIAVSWVAVPVFAALSVWAFRSAR